MLHGKTLPVQCYKRWSCRTAITPASSCGACASTRAWMTMLSITAPTRSPTSNMYPVFWTPSIRGTDQVYRSGNGAVLFCAAASAFYLLCPCVCRQFHSTLFFPRRRLFLPAVFVPAGSPSFPENGCLFCRKVVLYPGKKHWNTASAIYSTVSFRFYNVFCQKGFTNEFQKHII